MNIKVGTRGSKLALRQTQSVIDQMQSAYPEDSFEVVVIKTSGDKNQKSSIEELGSKGAFIDEIEKALCEDKIQLAVHSMKDLPAFLEDGLTLTKAWKREDPRDALILKEASSLKELKEGAVIATGSKRRKYQLLKLRPDLKVVDIRGNIDTRIRKLYEPAEDEPVLDGIVLAVAGLKRIGRENEITEIFSYDEMIPAPTQGILALEVRKDHVELIKKLDSLSDEGTNLQAIKEREFLLASGADCRKPVGAYLDLETDIFYTLIGDEEGTYLDIKKEHYDR